MGMNVVAAYLLLKLGTCLWGLWFRNALLKGHRVVSLGQLSVRGEGSSVSRAMCSQTRCMPACSHATYTPPTAGKEPSAADISAVISSAGAEADAAQVELLLKELDGKVRG